MNSSRAWRELISSSAGADVEATLLGVLADHPPRCEHEAAGPAPTIYPPLIPGAQSPEAVDGEGEEGEEECSPDCLEVNDYAVLVDGTSCAVIAVAEGQVQVGFVFDMDVIDKLLAAHDHRTNFGCTNSYEFIDIIPEAIIEALVEWMGLA